jgi:hypothetical protein
MTPPLILGFTGPAGAGKDTAAAYLEDAYGFLPIAFADPVRDMLLTLAQHVAVDGAWLTERVLKEQPLPVIGYSYRTLARSLGTQWGRDQLRADLWISIAEHKLRQALAGGDNVCITDVRFDNELAWLHSVGGRLVRLDRDGALWRPGEHQSEAEGSGLPAWRRISNNGSTQHLWDQLDVVVESLREAARTNPA